MFKSFCKWTGILHYWVVLLIHLLRQHDTLVLKQPQRGCTALQGQRLEVKGSNSVYGCIGASALWCWGRRPGTTAGQGGGGKHSQGWGPAWNALLLRGFWKSSFGCSPFAACFLHVCLFHSVTNVTVLFMWENSDHLSLSLAWCLELAGPLVCNS